MRSMTGYGRGDADHAGTKFSVELNSVNRKQSDIVINLPRDLAALEPRIRQAINEKISRGRMNVLVGLQEGANGTTALALDTALARSYHDAMLTLQKELSAPGEITIGTILQAPGVMRSPERRVDADEAWPAVERALTAALGELVKMREREGKHLAKDLIHRLKILRKEIKEIRAIYPEVVKKYRTALLERHREGGSRSRDRRRAAPEGSHDLRGPFRHLGRIDAPGKSSRPVRPSPPQERTGRPNARIHHPGNFPRTQYPRRKIERRGNFRACRRLQIGAGKNPRANPKP